MAKINTLNYQTVASWNGSQDLFIVEQPDGTKVATPAMVKQFIEAGDFEATGEIKDGHGNILADMAKTADVDAEIGDLSQTGLTGDSVAEQLETAKNQIAALAVKTYSDTAIRTVAANSFITFTITLNDSVLNAVVGYSVSDSVKCVPAICAFQSNKVVTMRVINTTNSEQGFKVSLYYI